MTTLYYDADADLSRLTGRRVAIIGYGSQGHAHALSLRDSGVDVRIGLPEGSKSRAVAEKEGLKVLTPAEAAKEADFIVILTPDHTQKQVYDEAIAPNLTKGKTLLFAHGFNIRFGAIVVPVQHPQGPQRDPSAGPVVTVLHCEVHRSRMGVLQQPPAVGL